jgi:hypothetical protein
MSYIDCRFRTGLHLAVIIGLGIGAIVSCQAFADTNLVDREPWVIDGTDDTGPTPSSITMSVKGQAAGAFSELAVSYDVGGTGVVTVATIKGSGEIRFSLPPPGEFGGSFFTTGYWDCDEGFVPTMSITELDVRLTGGKHGRVQFKGRLSNGTSMAAKNFTLILFPPQSDSVQADVRYKLFATRDFCIDQAAHTNSADFPAVRMAGNFLSASEQENDQTRYVKVVSKTCFFFGCVTRKKSFCNDVVNQDGFIITNAPPRLGNNTIWLAHTQPSPRNTPSLRVRVLSPSHGRLRPQGSVVESSDPTQQNVSFWANWTDAKAHYRNKQRVGNFHYLLGVVPPEALSCDVEQ